MLGTLVALWPYLWPADRRDLQVRVMVAFGLILVAKFVTIGVPFTFKWATDALVAAREGGAASALPGSSARRSRRRSSMA